MKWRLFAVCWLIPSAFFAFALSTPVLAITVTYPGASLGPDMFGRPGSLFPGNGVNLTGNTVIVNSGTIPGNVYGGMTSGAQDVSGNQALIRDGVIGSSVYGGASNGGAVFNNAVTVSGGSVNQDISGGFAPAGNAEVRGNQVAISGGSVLGRVTGGQSRNGNALNNTVTVSGGDIGSDIYGGAAVLSGNAVGNSVLITGGRVHALFGGYTSFGDTLNNQVRVSGLTDPSAISSSTIFGGYSDGGSSNSNSVIIADSPGLNTGTLTGGQATVLVTGNSVSISNSSLNSSNIFGAFTTNGSALSNSISITNSSVLASGSIIGAAAGNGIAADNAVNIANSSLTGGSIMGGRSSGGSAKNNTVTITDSSSSISGEITGGSAGNGAASGNIVSIANSVLNSGNIFGGIVIGGGDAVSNSVSLSNSPGLKAAEIYGGRSAGGNARGNNISITGSPDFNIQSLIGGMTFFGATAESNTVSITASPNFTVTGPIYGGFANFAPGKTGNTLILSDSSGAAAEVNGFQNYIFHLPNTLGNDQTLVAITGGTSTDMIGTNVAITGVAGGGKLLEPGNSVVLIDKATGLTPFQADNVPKGLALLYSFDVSTADGALRATVRETKRNPSTDVLPNGPAAGLIVINHYAELIDGLAASRILEPEERRKGPAVYARATGGTYTYNAGSDVDVNGVSFLAGVDWGFDNLTLGVFFETGRGNYDAAHHFDRLPTVKGDGDVDYYGGGLLAFLSLPADFYLEVSSRAGIVETDFHSDNVHFIDRDIDYDLSSAYYGAHAGVGWLPRLSDAATLDIYTKYLWVHQTGDDAEIMGDQVRFSASDSQTWRTGTRLSYAVTESFTPYIGAALDYEFDSEVKAEVSGYSVSSYSLKGGTGIGELGLAYKSESGLSLDLGVKGLVGEREGVLGTFSIGYDF